MNAFVTHPSSLLGASLVGALRWEGHKIASSVRQADVVFETGTGVVYRADRGLARFVFDELLAPGDVSDSAVGAWLTSFVQHGILPSLDGGAYVTDARDVALAMLAAAERGLSGEFDVAGPFVRFEELADLCSGINIARTNLAIPELGLTFRSLEETIHDVLAWLRSPEREETSSLVGELRRL